MQTFLLRLVALWEIASTEAQLSCSTNTQPTGTSPVSSAIWAYSNAWCITSSFVRTLSGAAVAAVAVVAVVVSVIAIGKER